MFNLDGIKITWLGHASFKIVKTSVIYIDPFQISNGEKADIILITHSHYDHCSIDDINKIVKPETTIIATPDCISKLSNVNCKVFKTVTPGDALGIDEVNIEVVPAYNLNKEFHPKANDWVGYVITMDGKKIYHAGDTDAIPEMNNLKVNVALVPVSGTYVMTAEEAANAVNKFMPGTAIPMHYGEIVGSKSDAEKFKDLCNVRVEILEKE
ncbi:MBL fold metallo-hydrolase [Candidatus Woesearchaeota archaeon]|nr:MBL fold metallo-hydrolase [Candidatus Woesearchaeota archaeon]